MDAYASFLHEYGSMQEPAFDRRLGVDVQHR